MGQNTFDDYRVFVVLAFLEYFILIYFPYLKKILGNTFGSALVTTVYLYRNNLTGTHGINK